MADTFSHRAETSAPPARIWEALQRAETWQGIGPISEVWDAEHTAEGVLAGYRWSAKAAGRTWKGAAKTASAEPGRSLTLDLTSPEIEGTISVDIQDGAVTVTMTASPRGFLASMFWSTVTAALQHGLADQVEEFAASFD